MLSNDLGWNTRVKNCELSQTLVSEIKILVSYTLPWELCLVYHLFQYLTSIKLQFSWQEFVINVLHKIIIVCIIILLN